MANKGSSKARKDRLSVYKAENRSQRNRTRKLEAHVRKHPNDSEAVSTLKKGVVVYRRKRPYNNKLWSPSNKIYAHHIRLYAGINGHEALKVQKSFDGNQSK